MSLEKSNGRLVVFFTLSISLILAILPMPQPLMWLRPDWVALVLLYWVLALPHRFSVGWAWGFGLLLDVLLNSPLGLHAFSLSIIAYLASLLHQRIRLAHWWQQALQVMVLVGIHRLILLYGNVLLLGEQRPLIYWAAVPVSAMLWPFVFTLLRAVRRGFRVQ
ncbi:rod shape-determining protein MreD [Pelagibaculum spongiae]|uniref:Rod shape-determining protein MreD n=1 Tax=Pelagibaculum spongiae TaxID=2080658 RepID=A0A2V1H0E0_9GAMM|nr:rod shape-determining protein MreD [Pelagibaculum spongiae]PVZ71933.1 rod shape-determining protein MreD [Pelagibaculum spongiae]